jgi:transcriptional regulator with XRE-family HTH domain
MTIDVMIGRTIRRWREERGLSLWVLAERICVTPASAQVRNGRERIDAAMLFSITQALNIEPKDIFLGLIDERLKKTRPVRL